MFKFGLIKVYFVHQLLRMSAIKNIGHVFHVSRTKKFKGDEVSKSSLALSNVTLNKNWQQLHILLLNEIKYLLSHN